MGIEAWRAALTELGPTFDGHAWEVEIVGATLTIEVVPSWKEEGDIRVSVPFADDAPRMRLVRPPHALSAAGRILTGDAALDARAYLFGETVGVLAVLGANTRRLMVELLDLGLSFGPRALVLEPWATAQMVGDRIADTLAKMVQLSRALAVPRGSQPFARIAALAAGDPDPEVRRNLAALAERHPEIRYADAQREAQHAKVADEATFRALEALVRDPSTDGKAKRFYWLRLFALFPVGRVSSLFDAADKGTADFLVVQLVSQAARPDAPLEALAGALLHLCDEHGPADPSAAIGVARVLGKARFVRGIRWLVRALAQTSSQEVMRAALEALLLMPVPAQQILEKLSEDALAFAIDEAPGLAVAPEAARGPLFIGLFMASQQNDGARSGRRPEVLVGYLERFARLDDPSIADLVAPLVEEAHGAIQIAALETLGAIGELRHLAAIAPSTRGFFRSSEIKRAATAAMDAIRTRHLPNAERGALALAEGDGGLTLSEDGDDGAG